ncbi:MAG: MFS transporter [Candidatus Xenobia bacterium]
MRPVYILFLVVFIDLIGFGMVMPLLPKYGELFGANATWIGLLGGVYSLMQFIMAPFWGSVSDRIGRRPVLLISLLGIAAAYLVFGEAKSFTVLFLSRAMAGAMAANISTAFAYVADVTTPEDRARGMGTVGMAFGLGFILGPVLGGIAGQHNIMLPPFIAAGFSLAAFLVAAARLPESRDPETRPREIGLGPVVKAFTDPQKSRWIYSFLFYMVAFASMEITLPYFITFPPFNYHAREIGEMFAYLGFVAAMVQGGGIRRLVKKHGEPRVALIGGILSAIGLAPLPFCQTGAQLMGALTLMAVGQGCCQPSLMSLISRSSSQGEQGTIMGVSQSLSSFGRIVGPAGGTPG